MVASLVASLLAGLRAEGGSHEASFSVVRTHSLPSRFNGMVVLPPGKDGNPRALFWAGRSKALTVGNMNRTTGTWSFAEKRLAVPFDRIVVLDLDGNGKDDLLLVSEGDSAVHSVMNTSWDTLVVSGTVHVPVAPAVLEAVDLTGDKVPDVLIADPDTPGMHILRGTGKGSFVPLKPFFPDGAISAAASVHLNNDFLPDIVAFDWIQSQLHILYGVGRGRFVDQSVFPVDGEVRRITPLIERSRLTTALLLWMKGDTLAQLWMDDGLGDFRQRWSLSFGSPVLDAVVADLNQDGSLDLVTLHTSGALEVRSAILDGDNVSFSQYNGGTLPTALGLVARKDGSPVEVVVLEKETPILRSLRIDRESVPLVDSLEFAAGVLPGQVIAGDWNRDGLPDLAIACAGSRSVAVHWGQRKGEFRGNVAYPVEHEPEFIAFHAYGDSSVDFVLSYPQASALSFLTVSYRENATVHALIPSEGPAEILRASGLQQYETEFVTLVAPAGGTTLAFYQQIAPETFVERSFRLGSPALLLGATVHDLNADGFLDVVFTYRPTDTSGVSLGVAFGDSTMSMRQRELVLDIPEVDVQVSYLWLEDFDGDDTLDLLVAFPRTARALYFMRGAGGGSFGPPTLIARNAGLQNRSLLQIIDLDGDRLPDLVVCPTDGEGVGWIRNGGGGTFEPFRLLQRGSDIGSFTFADLNGDAIPDLAVVKTLRGTVMVVHGMQFTISRKDDAK